MHSLTHIDENVGYVQPHFFSWTYNVYQSFMSKYKILQTSKTWPVELAIGATLIDRKQVWKLQVDLVFLHCNTNRHANEQCNEAIACITACNLVILSNQTIFQVWSDKSYVTHIIQKLEQQPELGHALQCAVHIARRRISPGGCELKTFCGVKQQLWTWPAQLLHHVIQDVVLLWWFDPSFLSA